jgi:hypothetical protein
VGEGKIDLASILRPVKCRVFNFFCLFTTQIIILKILLFFIFPLFNFLGRKDIGEAKGEFAPPCTLPNYAYGCNKYVPKTSIFFLDGCFV